MIEQVTEIEILNQAEMDRLSADKNEAVQALEEVQN